MASGRHGKPRREPTHKNPKDIMGTSREMAYML